MAFSLTWLGHAAFLMVIDDYNILIDPFLSGNPTAHTNKDSIKADFILVTHGHGDHVGDTVEIAKRCNAVVIANAEICGWLQKKGVRTHAQHIGGGYLHPFGYVKLTLALHGSSLPDGSDGGNPTGFLITTNNGQKIYFAGDTGLFGDMKLIGEEGLDLAVIPIGDNYTMGPSDALRAVKMLKPKVVVPMHYNTFNLIKQDPFLWAEMVQKETSSRVEVMQPGERFTWQR